MGSYRCTRPGSKVKHIMDAYGVNHEKSIVLLKSKYDKKAYNVVLYAFFFSKCKICFSLLFYMIQSKG